MKHIKELRGCGRGKRCLIIGGGLSVLRFDFMKIPESWDIIATNNHCYEIADIIIYYDDSSSSSNKSMAQFYKEHSIKPNQRLIAHKSGSIDATCPACTHYFHHADMIFGDTGFHALQFADKIFEYETIYLIGYDYRHNASSFHFEELESEKQAMERFEKHSIGKVLPKYARLELTSKVYNCNPDSGIDCFEFSSDYLTKLV